MTEREMFEETLSIIGKTNESTFDKRDDGSYKMDIIHFGWKMWQESTASRQAEIDELQKRIDDALDYVFGLYCTGDLDTERLENILKGKENE